MSFEDWRARPPTMPGTFASQAGYTPVVDLWPEWVAVCPCSPQAQRLRLVSGRMGVSGEASGIGGQELHTADGCQLRTPSISGDAQRCPLHAVVGQRSPRYLR